MRSTAGMLARTLAVGIAVGIAGPQVANAQQSHDARVADLVQAGKIRVGMGVAAPHWAIKDPAAGELRGLAIDLARALAMEDLSADDLFSRASRLADAYRARRPSVSSVVAE